VDRLLWRAPSELDRRVVDGGHQLPQRLDGVVDGVGDGARDVLGDRRVHGEVAIGEAAHLVEQPQDCLLVALVLGRLLGDRAPRVGHARLIIPSPAPPRWRESRVRHQAGRLAARGGGLTTATEACHQAIELHHD
jgi:hypothetical protein